MKTTLLFAALLFVTATKAQSLKKYSVSNSGCSLYSYCESKYEVDYSDDSSKVYTGECKLGDVTYGIICVKLLNTITDPEAAEELMISYVDFLKTSFNIKKAAGYGKGHHLNNNEKTRGILDYWEDKDKDQWKIKAWTDGNFIGFIYAYSKKELPEAKVNVFLDGFRLPELEKTTEITSSGSDVIIMQEQSGGTYKVPCELNGLKMSFIFDSGASDVSISLTEATFMLKNGYLKKDDIIDIEKYRIANGQLEEGFIINISELKIGNYILKDVRGSIVKSNNAPLLLGMSAIKKLGFKFDPVNGTLFK